MKLNFIYEPSKKRLEEIIYDRSKEKSKYVNSFFRYHN